MSDNKIYNKKIKDKKLKDKNPQKKNTDDENENIDTYYSDNMDNLDNIDIDSDINKNTDIDNIDIEIENNISDILSDNKTSDNKVNSNIDSNKKNMNKKDKIKKDKKDKTEESDDSNNNEVKPKKKPGRPKKYVVKKTVPKLGIVTEPLNNKISDQRLINIFELLYDNPIMFKKIFALLRSMSVESIILRLEKKYIKIYAVDHTVSNQIYIKIYGEQMNRYYVSKILEFGLSPVSIQKILQTLNKDCTKISWFTTSQYERSKIKIGLSNDEMEEDSIYTIDLDNVESYDWEVEDELLLENDYPLKFELPFRYFKKKVTDFKLLGEIMKIEKHGEHPLRLNYNFSNNKGDQSTLFKNPSKINLKSNIHTGEIFSTSVYLDHIKPLAGSLISDTIQISASIDKKLIFTSLLDQDENPSKEKIAGSERCEIKILTKIVDATK